MNQYITGAMIRRVRENKGLTQEALAEQLHVSSKTVSKWETGQGFPDVSLLEPIAKALDISIIELFSGQNITNRNRASNLLHSTMYICPVCGNSIFSFGQAVVSCCGIILSPLQADEQDDEHTIRVEINDGEYFVAMDHPMEKGHYVSCFGAISDYSFQLVKLYPEGPCEARFRTERVRSVFAYCTHHGLFRVDLKGKRR